MKSIIAQWNWLPEKIKAKENKNKSLYQVTSLLKIHYASLLKIQQQ